MPAAPAGHASARKRAGWQPVASPRELLRASKRLSFILRHDPHSVGLTLDDAGWVDVEELLVGAGPQGHSVPVDLDWRGRHHVHPSADVETATAGHLFYRFGQRRLADRVGAAGLPHTA